jgi:hypothetical protein
MSEKVQDTITYIGRSFIDLKSYRYILGSNREEIHFSKKLQKHHQVGETYPVTISETEQGRLFSTSSGNKALEHTWPIPEHIATWVKEDAQAQAADRANREAKSLLTQARKAARTIKLQYKRASGFNKRAIIRAFIEELEN